MEWIYRSVMARRRARNLKRRESEKAPCPVVSVGNLTVGGTGKTPAVQWLAREFQKQGLHVGIALRGYGGTRSEIGAIVSSGKRIYLKADEAGDEAILHTRSVPGAVVSIAKDRHHAVQLAYDYGAQVVILDDGFQFWSLPRDFDLVLLDAKNPFDNRHLLPFGRLREEPKALERADAILLTRSNRATGREIDQARHEISCWTDAPVFLAKHISSDLRDEKSGEILPLHWLKHRTVKAFAGLADNAQFYTALERQGTEQIIKLRQERGDHHKWQRDDFEWFEMAPHFNAYQAEKFDVLPAITTEKDVVKLDPSWFEGPLLSLRIALDIRTEGELKTLISSRIILP